MITRYLSSALIGLAVTSGLLFLMHILIEVSEAVESSPRSRINLTFVPTLDETPVEIERKKPARVTPPVEPPPLIPPVETTSHLPTIGFRPPPEFPRRPLGKRPELGISDNALINIITVRPVYPGSAARNGLEGLVVVQFDVTETGAVRNVVVVESSHRVFNQPAIDAAYRFRYKARVVDGVPTATGGIRKQFRFELEKD